VAAELNALDEPVSNLVGERNLDIASISLDPDLHNGLGSDRGVDADFTRPYRRRVERILAGWVAAGEFFGDVDHVSPARFVEGSIYPGFSQFAIPATVPCKAPT
jgi:hypothetical protein